MRICGRKGRLSGTIPKEAPNGRLPLRGLLCRLDRRGILPVVPYPARTGPRQFVPQSQLPGRALRLIGLPNWRFRFISADYVANRRSVSKPHRLGFARERPVAIELGGLQENAEVAGQSGT